MLPKAMMINSKRFSTKLYRDAGLLYFMAYQPLLVILGQILFVHIHLWLVGWLVGFTAYQSFFDLFNAELNHFGLVRIYSIPAITGCVLFSLALVRSLNVKTDPF